MLGNRVGAGTYLLVMSLTVNAWCGAMIGLHESPFYAQYSEYVGWVLGAVVGSVFFYFSRRRFQDLNMPGFLSRILSFPFFGVIFLPLLCFTPGPRYSNQYGDHQEPSGFLKFAAAFSSFVLALVLVPYVSKLYRG